MQSLELTAAVANTTAAAIQRALSSVYVVSANPATNVALGINVYQDEGQPMRVVHLVGLACPLADGSVEWQVGAPAAAGQGKGRGMVQGVPQPTSGHLALRPPGTGAAPLPAV